MSNEAAPDTVTNWILVENAGTPAVNGYYRPNGMPNGAPMYVRLGEYEGEPCKFTIAGVDDQWFLVGVSEGGNREGYGFYWYERSPGEDSESIKLPPTQGWSVLNCIDRQGLDPPPTLTFVDPDAEKFKRVRLYTERVAKEAFTPAWKLRMHQAIAQYVLHKQLDDTGFVDREFQRLEFFECINVLEMVVWKSATMLEKFPAGSFKDYYQVMDWIKEGWKAKKAETRRSSFIQVVMENTVSFMDKPSADAQTDGMDRQD